MMADLTAEWCRDGAQMGEDIAEALDAAGAPDTAKEERLNSAALRIAARVLDEKTVEEVAELLCKKFNDELIREGEGFIGVTGIADWMDEARAVLAYLKGDPT
jgi:hypothetical protein